MTRIELSTEWQSVFPVAPRIAVVVSRTNDFITARLRDGAVARLRAAGIDDPVVVEVAGAYELVTATRVALDSGCAGVVAIGAIVRGDTPHFDYIAQGVTSGLTQLAAAGHAVSFGVLTVDTVEQAAARSGGALGNKGAEAAEALLQLVVAMARLRAAGRDGVGAKS